MKIIEFNGKFDGMICLDGVLPGKKFFRHFKDLTILAADGAVIHLIKLNIKFDKVIGDLDTLKRKGYFALIPEDKKVYVPNQDYNDFDKTLSYAKDIGLKNILVTGFHGGELEHTLNNWSVFMRYSKSMNLCIYENERYGIPLTQSIIAKTDPGEIISIIPQTAVEISTKGLKWELNKEIMILGEREGARNIAEGYEINIEIHSGSLLLFLNARLPFAPVY